MNTGAALIVNERLLAGARIACVALNGATTLNVVDESLMRDAHATLARLLARPELRCVLFGGRDARAFVGGANLHALEALTPATAESFIRSIHEFALLLRTARVPVIAVMRGYCLGAGLEIAAACDVRVGDGSVRCGMPEVRVGVPSVIEAALLPQIIGWGKARELLLRGHIIDAEEAARIGLLQHLAPAGGLDALADTIAADIIAGAPGALAAQKRLCAQWQDSNLSAAIEHGVSAFVEACAGDEPARYIERFFTARPPRSR